MPVVEVHLTEGFATDEKSRLISSLTEAVGAGAPDRDDAFSITLLEHMAADEPCRNGMGGSAPALAGSVRLVMDYLSAMEARDLDRARSLVSDGFAMVFPGTAPMTSLAELIDWAKNRYRSVAKSYDAVEAFQSGSKTVVYARGTLSGEWPNGRSFDGIRFIDRFEVSSDKLTGQEVWNDLAEVRAQ